MRRMLAAAAMGAAIVVGLAVPALAKGLPGEEEDLGFEAVAIVGPGLSGPISFAADEARSYGEFSRTFSGTKMNVKPTAMELGPMYRVTYTIACPSSSAGPGVVTYHQELYPYAVFGDFARAWTYTPAGQPTCAFMGSPGGGWAAAARELTHVLVDAGMPATAPSAPAVAPPAPVDSAPVPVSNGLPVWAFALIAAALTAGLVAGGLWGWQGWQGRHGRRSPRPSATI